MGSDARAFLVAHDAAPGVSRRHYDYAWGLTYYLCFDRRLLGSQRLDQYVARRSDSQPPVPRFGKLVGQKLRDFEPVWRGYIRSLR